MPSDRTALNLKGNERPRVAPLDNLCNLPGCFKYINAGDYMVRWGSFNIHVECASRWCESHGIEPQYADKERG